MSHTSLQTEETFALKGYTHIYTYTHTHTHIHNSNTFTKHDVNHQIKLIMLNKTIVSSNFRNRLTVLNTNAPLKWEFIQARQVPFMNKELQQTIMIIPKIENQISKQ